MNPFKSEIAADTHAEASTPENLSLNTPEKGNTEHDAQGRDLDKAYWYVQEHDTSQWSVLELKALRRKIDWWIVPIMFCCYTMQFIDKVLLNVCSVYMVSFTIGPYQIHSTLLSWALPKN